MQAFTLMQPTDVGAAVAAASQPGVKYIAGGTDLLQLMKNDVEAPVRLVDLEGLNLSGITVAGDVLRLGATAPMSDVAAHPAVRELAPAVSMALLSAASPQVRNMGTMGGNLLQRTRCGYFRDTGFSCNKRVPGSGCPAIRGENRMLAILGGSEHCIATQPSDMPVALVALDARVELQGAGGATRELPIRQFYRLPGDTPHVETNMQPGELITAMLVPVTGASRRSAYLKVRDRASFEFALVSVAVGLDLQGGQIVDARVAAGGVGTIPWHLPEVETALRGGPVTPERLRQAAMLAGQGAQPATQNAFKLPLLRNTVRRALEMAVA
jgi:xanthine dehydrogenase YagS FAD-binding subunit